MDEINAIRTRHSVRAYLPKEIEAEKVEKINAMIAACNQEGNLRMQFCKDAGRTFNRLLNKAMGLGSAPSVIACVGPDDETLEERVGYYGEKIVLLAQEIGLNTCWAGIFQAKNVPVDMKEGEKLPVVIAIGYGANSGKPHKSKTMEQVSPDGKGKPEWFHFGVEMALLAPTAMNQQKFEIRFKEDETVEFQNKGGPFGKVDLGIVKYHFEVGANHIKRQEMKENK